MQNITWFKCHPSFSLPLQERNGSRRLKKKRGSALAWLCSPIRKKTRMNYSDTFQLETALTSLAIWATVVCMSDWTTQDTAFAPHVHQWGLSAHDPVTSSPLILPWTTFVRYWPLQTGKTPQKLQFWDDLSGYHNLASVKLAQILALSHISCF